VAKMYFVPENLTVVEVYPAKSGTRDSGLGVRGEEGK